ncbi:porin OmpA [Aeromonas hydrophila]|uniref:porin OmpA n=2 Tax=Aeromonas hydrophila TaxID=644 RepID=UPI000493277D|nr:porin OmpA [Aeromonas hydrophila]MBM0512742.1 porin OmpA [Aeromonas hydrophila]MBW3774183.1 porin OmpA [Aeromonas hydrophila]HAT1544121.1 porin OmpA [Aeromonas hydrophila]HAT1554636.1 porin OmpA [Aeromonas hydrophila]HAU4893232.1 porin OmpA [Aeromonas hydrophila]
MNKSILAVLVSGLLVSGGVQAAAQDNTWYAGGKAGWSKFFDVDQKQVVSDTLGALQNTSTSKDTLGLGAFAGYQLNPNLGFEFGYDWFGKYTSSGELSGVRVEGEAKSQMIQTTMKIGFPVNDALDLYGRIGGGYAWTNSELSAQTATDFIKDTGNKHGAVFVGALGAEYAIDRDWAARLEYQYTTPLGDTSLDRAGIEMDNGMLAFAMLYRFGQQGGEVAAPAPAPAAAPAPAVVVVPKTFSLSSDVLFEFNKATLKPAASQALDNLFSQIVAANPKDGVATVIGHTDRIGSDAYNQALSEQRARSVADYLIAKGLFADKVRVEGRGKSSPITGSNCSSGSKPALIACLAPDRRVEVRLEGVSQPAQ